ncbi:MAG: hypothetical protein V7695_19740 [Sulfitobacter sp.]
MKRIYALIGGTACSLIFDEVGVDFRAIREIGGIQILDERLLIPFKARAFVDLTKRRKNGETVKEDDIKKHRNDVFRLMPLLTAFDKIDVSRSPSICRLTRAMAS